MQIDILSQPALEELYEKVILPQFGIVGGITWNDHLTIGPDNEAHVFMWKKKRMALVFDDYPTTDAAPLSAEFPHCAVTRLARDSVEGDVNADDNLPPVPDDEYILRFGPKDLPFKYVHDVTGYFQLFSIEQLNGVQA